MNVKKERQMAPKTPTYSVWADDDEYEYTVAVIDGKPHCLAHGEACEHAHAVADKLAGSR